MPFCLRSVLVGKNSEVKTYYYTYRHYDLKYTGEYATAQISQPDFRPTAQTQKPTVCLDLVPVPV